jgi:hypothetical protein
MVLSLYKCLAAFTDGGIDIGAGGSVVVTCYTPRHDAVCILDFRFDEGRKRPCLSSFLKGGFFERGTASQETDVRELYTFCVVELGGARESARKAFMDEAFTGAVDEAWGGKGGLRAPGHDV